MLDIAFEGIDLAGKDTQIYKLLQYYHIAGNKVNIVASISDNELGRAIRNVLKSDMDIDKYILIASFLTEIKRANKVVDNMYAENKDIALLNRWFYSTIAYNASNQQDKEYIIRTISDLNIKHATLTIWLDLPANIAIERLAKRSGKDFERFEKADVLARVAKNYDDLFNSQWVKDNTNVLRVDATQSPEDIFNDIIDYIEVYKQFSS